MRQVLFELPRVLAWGDETRLNMQLVRFTYNEDKNVIMTVTGSASQMRGSGYLPRQAAVSWVQTNGSEQEFRVLKNL